jgi:DNA-binding IclR family transcriptional regulator
VAAPVRDHRGDVVAGISVWGPVRRIDVDRLEGELLPAVLHAAAVASESLGHVRA